MTINWDKLGVVLSVGCMIHCLLLPIILPILPMIGFVFDHDSGFHFILSFVIVAVGSIALIRGVKKHGIYNPLIIGIAGMLMVFTGGLVEMIHHDFTGSFLITMLGGINLVIAHVKNHRLSCACSHHGDH